MNSLITKNKINLDHAIETLNVSETTKNTYRFAMNSYIKHCNETKTDMDLDSLKAWIILSKTPSTQAIRSAAAKKVFNVVLKGDPRLSSFNEEIDGIRKVKRDLKIKESQYLTKDEVEKVIELSSERIGLMVRTLFITGLRISELLNIKFSDCTPIRDGKVYEIMVVGKRSKENVVHINKELYDRIMSVFQGEKYLFEHDGVKYRREYVSFTIKKAGEKIGKHIGAHTLRHSRAYDLMEKGISIDKVSKFLNHASITTTANSYLHTKPSLEELGII